MFACRWSGFLLSLALLFSPPSIGADLLISGGPIYTANKYNSTAQAVLVRDNSIVFVGTLEAALDKVQPDYDSLDLKGRTLIPGLIEGHGHLAGLGSALVTLDLSDVSSFEQLVERVASAASNRKQGEWIIGWGWHQSKWNALPADAVAGFPTHTQLSAVVPDHPVYLIHASGHAAFVNQKALDVAGVNANTLVTDDGELVKDNSGRLTGILNENATALIASYAQPATTEQASSDITRAIDHLHVNGITSFHDAGSTREELLALQALAQKGSLRARIYSMVSTSDDELVDEWLARGPLIGGYDNYLTVRSLKVHGDGALGSRGAWLLDEYSDAPGHFGMATFPMEQLPELTVRAIEHGFQLNVHAIGDRTNRVSLDVMEAAIKAQPAFDHRFRIEHAQHIDPTDLYRFAELGIIASMQAIHMSSDRPWAIHRLGLQRITEGAYMWADLIDSGVVIVNGTDVPIEPINPIANFYASVTRKTLVGEPQGGYEPKQKMSREQALKSMTWNAAFGAFEENIKGSIETGKLADLTVLSQDIMSISENRILETKVEMTIIDGQVVYQRGTE